MALDDYLEEARLAGRALADYGGGLLRPTLRLGVTGLSRSGKTIFITALIHALLYGTRLPVFEALTSGRIARVKLSPQPDAAIPRFDYEKHLRDLLTHRRWPESTRTISEIRIEIEYQTQRGREKTLTLDIVDYPGEWLLDLLLLDKTYEQWSAETIARSREARARCSRASGTFISTRSTRRRPPTSSTPSTPRSSLPSISSPAATSALR